jgi:Transcriptional regulator, AbiEi antitoxin/Protein of unknown function (DUF559)
MSTRDVIAFAKRHGGIIATREAIDLGMAKSTISRRVADGVFDRIGRGILALPGTSTRPDAVMRAAGRLIGGVVSHMSAAEIHHMDPISKTAPTITVPHRGTYTFPGVHVHQSTDLLPGHIMKIGSLRVTTPARTIIDLSRALRKRRLTHLIDNALAEGIVDLEDLITLYLALTRQGKTGMRALGQILRERATGELVSISVLERRFLDLLVDAGLPVPTREFHAPWLEPINGRVDFAYVDQRIVIEADSRRWHGLFQAFETDKRRDIAAQLEGWIVLRITWKMITEDPGFVLESVGAALTLGVGRASRGS